jgi:hypothetical protein
MQLRLLGSTPPASTPVTKDLMTTSASPRHLAGRPTSTPAPTASSSAPVAGSPPATTSRLLQQVTPAVSALRAFGDIGRHLLIPLFLATGMALAYLGAFHQPTPHALPTAVVGTSVEAKVFAQQLNDASDGALTVRTVPTADDARQMIRDRELSGAYQTVGDHAVLFVSPADSATTATAVTEAFAPIAYAQHQPLKVQDVVPVNSHDRSGQGLFFLLVALSIGGYTSAIAISAAAAHLTVLGRVGVAAVTTAVVAVLGTIVAGPVYGIITEHHVAICALAWLYVAGITLVGLGLHPIFKRWTTPLLTMLFVMLNFTSSGGVFQSQMMPRFFSALHGFWNGAAWLEAASSRTYFRGADMGRPVLTLLLWALGGLALIALSHTWSVHRNRVADEDVAVSAEEEGVLAT